MQVIAHIKWPGEASHVTKVWKCRTDGRLVFWTGPEDHFAYAEIEMEEDADGGSVGTDLVELHLDLLEQFHEYMADSDRNLLQEIDALLEAVRAAS